MNEIQKTAYRAFIHTLDVAQRAAFLDCLGSQVENDEVAEHDEEELLGLTEAPGHLFLVAARDVLIEEVQL